MVPPGPSGFQRGVELLHGDAMECPICSTENIDGTDQCTFCQADLAHPGIADSRSDIERDLIRRPLADIAVQDYVVVGPNVSVRNTLLAWSEGNFHCAIIVDGGAILGIFTERDVLRNVAHDFERCADDPIGDHMTPSPSMLESDLPIAFALNRMTVGGYRHVPITRNQVLYGVVSVRDMLAYMHDRFIKPSVTGPEN